MSKSLTINTLKIFRKQTLSSIALILILTVSAIIVSLPVAKAHTPAWNIPTYAYVAVAPNTVGVGDYTLIVMWLDKFPPTAGGLGGDRWRGFKVDITKPDKTTQTIGPIEPTSQVGSAYTIYTPDQVGDYSIVFSWPGQTLTNGTGTPDNGGIPFVGDYFQPAKSAPVTLHVQQNQISNWVEPPVPTDYWTRPIPTANREWTQLASNWPGGSWLRYRGFQESGQAPNSAHIVYTRPIINGGIADERYGAVKYDTTDYENFFPAPIVMGGKIYYNAGTYPNYGYYCVDLRTGEQLWYKNGTDNGLNNPYTLYNLGGGGNTGPNLADNFAQLSFGQLFHYYSVNGEGIKDHLWMALNAYNRAGAVVNTTWYMLDANTGNWELTLKNMPSGTSVTDQDGDLLLYSYNAQTGRFLAWNSTQSIPPPSPAGTTQQQWEPRTGATIDAVNDTSWLEYGPSGGIGGTASEWDLSDIQPRSGYTMNITGPVGLPALSNVLQDDKYVPRIMFFSDMRNIPGYAYIGSSDMFFLAAAVQIDYHVNPYSPFPNKTGTQNNNLGYGVTLLWNKTITKPLGGNLTFSVGPVSYEDKVFTLYSKETMQWWGYSLNDGSLLWGPSAAQPSWDMYGSGAFYAYGKLFSGSYSGVLYAYDIKTGKNLWTYTLNEIGHESPYGNFQISYGGVADNKVYIYSSEHSPTQPLWRGSYLRCINATDGTELWKILNFVSGMAIADGYIVAGNHYDNQMYVYGKGPSALTVSAPQTAVPKGTPVLIQGTVTDQSPGAKGTPAIADASQQAWMEYLYEDQAQPTNATGVPVTLTAIDPNGNTQNIGTITSDTLGAYAVSWTPPVPGLYTVLANFAGTKSYGGSIADTHFVVASAVAAAPTSPQAPATPVPTTAPTQTAPPSPQVTTTPVPPPSSPGLPTTYIAIAVVAIIVVVAAAALALRRRK